MAQNTKDAGASLKPCPFCGSVNISEGEVLTSNPDGGASTQSMCRDCGALGPDAHLRAGEVDYGDIKATIAWNRRAPTAEQAESTIATGGAQEPVAGGESRPQNFCGCIEWSSYKNRHGYGTLKADGRISLAHRVMYCDYNGVSLESIQDLVVRHACDNPGCINPAHLLLGTHADNTQDKVERGRQAKGERNGQSKLTSHQVAQIRSLYVRGSREFGTPALARKFGVGETTIRKIILNLRWVHVSSTGDQS